MEKKRCYGCMRLKVSEPFCEHCGHDQRSRNAPHQLPAGTVLREQYLVGKVLGQGGFGITYLGWDLYLDIPVAIKEYYPTGMVMREATQTFSVVNCLDDNGDRFHNNRDRFMREAKMLARFAYVPEIVQIKNFFLANNTAYIVMEYVQGITLKEYVRRRGGSLSAQETFAILRPIMAGLSKIHKAGLVHRDISPDNIMMLPGGGAKLLDFGAVRDVGAAQVNQELSRSTDAILKQGYAPIEQYQQKGALGPWSDVYALCATIYYCLTGTVPPDSPARMLDAEKLTFAPQIGLDRRQTRALQRGMAVRAADRPRNMEELYQELFGTPIPSEDDGPHPEPPKPPVEDPETPAPPRPKKKNRWLLPVVLLLIAGAVGAWLLTRPQEPRLADRIPTEETTQGHLPRPEEQEDTLPTDPPEEPKPQEPAPRPVIQNAQENTLMEHTVDDVQTGPQTPAFCTNVTREQVSSITVLYDTSEAPDSAVDVSLNGNGKVLAWTQANGELFDLYLAAEGGIYAPANSEYLFAFFSNAQSINFNDAFFTDNVENASAMFYKNINLLQLDTGNLRTGKMTDMSWMFSGCEKLENLEVSHFETGNVTAMNSMFQSCESLKHLNVSNFNTEKVTTMRYMFTRCEQLERLDVSGFRTEQVTQMQYMFNGCVKVPVLNVSGFTTDKVTDMSHMFSRCSSVKNLDVSGFVTGSVKDMSGMFNECASLTRLDVSGFDTCLVENMSEMFDGCADLTSLNVSGFKTENVTDLSSMFAGCANLTALDVSGFQTGNATTLRGMFEGCSKVPVLAVDNFDTGKVTDMSYLFNMCHCVTELNLGNWNTERVTEMIAIFRDCTAMTQLNIGKFNTANVTTMARMFENCTSLPTLNIGSLKTNNVSDMEYMFSGCASLTQLNVSGFVTTKVDDMQYMFQGCKSLKSLDISRFDTANVTNMQYMFFGCESLTNLKLGTFNTSGVLYNENFMDPGKQINGKAWTELFS